MNQNKFIEFFKKKQVKVVLGILVIAGIMTAMSIGIIAFIRSLRQPPDDDCNDGIGKLDTDLKMCVAKDCDNICQKGDLIGKCLDNLCDSISGGEPDFENCTCTKTDCLPGQEARNATNPSLKYTEMLLTDPNDKYGINGYKSKNQLFCGQTCSFSDKNFCFSDKEICAVSFDKNSEILDASAAEGCLSRGTTGRFSEKNYTLCGNEHDTIEGARIACNPQNIGNLKANSCIENTPPNSMYPGKRFSGAPYYCEEIVKKCDGSNEEKFCIHDSDCDQSVCEVNSTLEAKGFLFLKTCSGRENEKSNKYCKNINDVGEHAYSGTQPTKKKLFYSVTKPNHVGITLNQPCNTGRDEPMCDNHSIKNNWYCAEKGTNYTCVSNDEKTVLDSCPEYPPISSFGENELYKVYCCDRSTYADKQNFCCPTNSNNDLCLNMSSYKVDSSWLESSNIKGVNIPISCSKDEDCRTTQNLNALNTLLDSTQSVSENEYSQFFCRENECRFNAGYIESLDNGDYAKGKYIMADDKHLETSIAVKKDTDYEWADANILRNDFEIPLCVNQAGGNQALFGQYTKNSFTPVDKTSTSAYVRPTIVDYTTDKLKNINRASCIKYGIDKNYYQVTSDGSVAELKNILGSQVESSSEADKILYDSQGIKISKKTNINGQDEYQGSCKFNSLCNDLKSTVITSSDQESSKILEWNFSGSEYPNSGIYAPLSSTQTTPKRAYFAVMPKLQFYNPKSGLSCATFSADQCEEIPNPSDINKYKDLDASNLLSPCYWNGQNCVNRGTKPPSGQKIEDGPQFYITDNGFGEYCKSGWRFIQDDPSGASGPGQIRCLDSDSKNYFK